MQFDPENNIIKLCAQGMEMEGQGRLTSTQTFFASLEGIYQRI